MKITVTIQNPDKTIFQGEVAALSSFNQRGRFDVLPEHTNFLSIIENQVILHKLDGTHQTIKIDRGILRVYRDSVEIFLGVGS